MNAPPSERKPPLYTLTRARILEFVREPEALFWVFAFPIIMARRPRLRLPRPAARSRCRWASSTGRPRPRSRRRSRSPALVRPRMYPDREDGLAGPAHRQDHAPRRGAGRSRPRVPLRPHAPRRAPGPAGGRRRDPARARAARTRRRARVDRMQEKGSRYIDFLLPGILGLNLMGTGIWGIGFSIVNARLKKTAQAHGRDADAQERFPARADALAVRRSWSLEVGIILAFGVSAFQVPIRGSLCAARPDTVVGRADLRGHGASRRRPGADTRGRQRPDEPGDGADVASLGRLLLVGALSRGGPALHPGAAPDRAQRRAARRDAGGQRPGRHRGPSSRVLAAWALVSFAVALRIFRWQ